MDGQLMQQLMSRYGSMSAVPERVLRENGLLRIKSVQTATHRFVSAADHTEGTSQIENLLQRWRDYLSPSTLELFDLHVRGETSLSLEFIEWERNRVSGFLSAKLPPLYPPWTTGHSKATLITRFVGSSVADVWSKAFPVVDFIIAFMIGTYDSDRAQIAAVARKSGGNKTRTYAIRSMRAQDVEMFCARAFAPDGTISPHAIREICHHASERFNFRSEDSRLGAIEHTKRVIEFLERSLGTRASRLSREYETWDGNREFFKERCWYLRFSPEDRLAMATAYFESVDRMPTGDEKNVWNRMRVVFTDEAPAPELFAVRQEQARAAELYALMERAVAQNEYLELPSELFEVGKYPAFLDACAGYFRTWLRAAGKENAALILQGTGGIKEHSPIPDRVLHSPKFATILHEERLRRAQQLSDDEFWLVFNGRTPSFLGGGRKSDNAAGARLHEYVWRRMAELKKKKKN